MIKSKAIAALAALWHKIARGRDVDEPVVSVQSAEDEAMQYKPPTQTEKNRAKRQRKKSRKSF